MNKISAVYKILNTITGDFYVGSSKNVMRRWANHKCPSTWKEHPNSPLYQNFQKYGLDKFRFQILAPVMPEYLKVVEEEFIELLHPTYNKVNANGEDIERRKETQRKYRQTEKYKEYQKEYQQSEKGKESVRKYRQSEKGKEVNRKGTRKYLNQLCTHNGETLTLITLYTRFRRAGIEHPFAEAKKYLIK